MDDEKIIIGQNEVWKIKRNNDISKKVWMIKKNHGLEQSMENKKNDDVSYKVWMMQKKSWV